MMMLLILIFAQKNRVIYWNEKPLNVCKSNADSGHMIYNLFQTFLHYFFPDQCRIPNVLYISLKYDLKCNVLAG